MLLQKQKGEIFLQTQGQRNKNSKYTIYLYI